MTRIEAEKTGYRGAKAPPTQNGFTMVELMVVVAIIGILLAIVVPGYSENVRKSRRADAMKELMELGAAQERFYAQNSRYTDDLTSSSGLNRGVNGENSSGGHYTLSAGACVDPIAELTHCYLLKAVPRNNQTNDLKCGTLTLDRLGQRSATGSLGDRCW